MARAAARPTAPRRSAQDPSQDKFRRIRLGNAAFQARVGGLEGGTAVLELLGFAREGAAGDALVLPADKARRPPPRRAWCHGRACCKPLRLRRMGGRRRAAGVVTSAG